MCLSWFRSKSERTERKRYSKAPVDHPDKEKDGSYKDPSEKEGKE